MRIRINVSFDLPEGAERGDALEYVADAVGTWHGSLRPPGSYTEDDPGDPMYSLDGDSINVSTIRTIDGKRHILRM